MMEPKSYIRVDSDGVPQLVQVYPVMSGIGVLDPEHAAVYLDEEGPHIATLELVDSMLKANHCVSIEKLTHGKVRVH